MDRLDVYKEENITKDPSTVRHCCVESTLTKDWVLLILTLFSLAVTCIYGDPGNMIMNGDFEWAGYPFSTSFPAQDAIHDGQMAYIPYYEVLYGGVQLLDATQYAPQSDAGGSYILHMNYWYGPGVLLSYPLITPRKGATYKVTFDMADNPDGGSLYKIVRVRVLVNNEKTTPEIQAFNISTPDSRRDTILWMSMTFNFVGTGETTTLQFESLVQGSYGALIDNIKVILLSLVDNGSFERYSSSLMPPNTTSFYAVLSPGSVAITSWTVSGGMIKWASNDNWQSSTDESTRMLDMNDNQTAGIITSNSFSTRVGGNFRLLFDLTANPDDTPTVEGYLSVSVISKPSEKVLASKSFAVSGDGFSPQSMGWMTQKLDFKSEEKTTAVQFQSLIVGSEGPLLDNVLAYEILPTGGYTSVPLTYGAGSFVKPCILTMIILPTSLTFSHIFNFP